MKKLGIIITAAIFMSFYSCKDDDTDQIDDPIGGETIDLTYNFEADNDGWDGGIADIPADDENLYEFEAAQTTAPFGENEGVLLLSASNPNDVLFMYASKHVSGLEPNTRYDIDMSVSFVPDVVIDTTGFVDDTTGVAGDTTGVPSDTTGAGIDTTNLVAGNDTVVIKAGVVAEEPATEADELDFLQLVGIDIGENGVDGADLIVLGTYPGNGAENDYPLQTASTESPFSITTNDEGELWLIVAAESSGTRAEIYIDNIEVAISKE